MLYIFITFIDLSQCSQNLTMLPFVIGSV